MNDSNFGSSAKRPGPKRKFNDKVEELIARRYLKDDWTAEKCAEHFKGRSSDGTLSPTGVRHIATRVVARLKAEGREF